MGTIILQGAMASSWSKEWREAARQWVEASKSHPLGWSVFFSENGINGYSTVAIVPSGSKLGWEDHDAHLALVESLRALADQEHPSGGFRLADFARFCWGHELEHAPWIDSNCYEPE